MNLLIAFNSRVDQPASLRRRHVAGLPLVCVVALLLQGCALLGKADMISTRYFEPEVPHGEGAKPPSTTPAGAPLELQFGRVTASGYLKRRLVYRTSNVELGTYEDRQWTERPEEYARRAMSHALFRGQGITQVLYGGGPTLEVELTAFEEIRRGGRSHGRVTIRYVLRDETSVWLSDVITVDRATKSGSRKPEAVVAAISSALNQAAGEVAKAIAVRLKKPPSDAPGARPCAPLARDAAVAPGR